MSLKIFITSNFNVFYSFSDSTNTEQIENCRFSKKAGINHGHKIRTQNAWVGIKNAAYEHCCPPPPQKKTPQLLGCCYAVAHIPHDQEIVGLKSGQHFE